MTEGTVIGGSQVTATAHLSDVQRVKLSDCKLPEVH
jgi:hypothetical protein